MSYCHKYGLLPGQLQHRANYEPQGGADVATNGNDRMLCPKYKVVPNSLEQKQTLRNYL